MSKPWQELSLQLGRNNTSLGSTISIPNPIQDSYTSEFLIYVEGTVTTAAATAAIEGLPSIIQTVNINGPLPQYNTLTPINGLTGPMLVEVGQFIRRSISYSFGSLGSTGKFGVYVPCTFINPRLRYPYSHMSILPTIAMGAVNFTIQIANQAQLDTNGTPTIVINPLTVSVQQNEYKPSSIPPLAAPVPITSQNQAQMNQSFMFIASSLNFRSNNTVETSAQSQQLFPNGTYLLLLVRAFTATSTANVGTVRQADTGTAGPMDTSVTSQGLVLQDTAQQPKKYVDWGTLRWENENTTYDSLVAGNACFQFNNGINSVFQPAVGPNQIPLNYASTTTGTTNPRIDFVYQQIFDAQNWLGLL